MKSIKAHVSGTVFSQEIVEMWFASTLLSTSVTLLNQMKNYMLVVIGYIKAENNVNKTSHGWKDYTCLQLSSGQPDNNQTDAAMQKAPQERWRVNTTSGFSVLKAEEICFHWKHSHDINRPIAKIRQNLKQWSCSVVKLKTRRCQVEIFALLLLVLCRLCCRPTPHVSSSFLQSTDTAVRWKLYCL